MIHRDLKSGNVMVTADGRVKVLDFGLAKRVWEGEEGAPTQPMVTLTESGVVVGTPHYLAPEVLHGGKADAVSDVWALGVVLYEMASGTLPFQGVTTYELSAAILNETPAALPASVPAGLRAVILGCLAKQPGERIQRAGEVRAVLEALRSDAGQAPAGGTSKWTRHGIRVAVSLVVLVVVVAAAWLAWVRIVPKRSLVERQLTYNTPTCGGSRWTGGVAKRLGGPSRSRAGAKSGATHRTPAPTASGLPATGVPVHTMCMWPGSAAVGRSRIRRDA